MGALAPLAAIGLATLFPGIQDVTRSRFRRSVEISSVLVALHAGGLFAVWDSKRQDADEYHRRKANYVLAGLRRLGPGERIAVIGTPAYSFHGLMTDYDTVPGRDSPLVHELEGLFIWRTHVVNRLNFEAKAGERHIVLVVDLGLADPGPYSIVAWRELSTALDRPK